MTPYTLVLSAKSIGGKVDPDSFILKVDNIFPLEVILAQGFIFSKLTNEFVCTLDECVTEVRR